MATLLQGARSGSYRLLQSFPIRALEYPVCEFAQAQQPAPERTPIQEARADPRVTSTKA